MTEFITLTIQSWQNAWANKAFRKTLVLGIILLVISAASTTLFFNYIEDYKGGIAINDWLLHTLPAVDVSVPIVCIASVVIFTVTIRCGTDPNLFLTLVWAFVFQLISRIISIGATRFFAPPELIQLKDPFGSILYHSRFITRDLFYSGHTAFLFQFFLCSKKKIDRPLLLIAALTVGFLLLIQHVHYTVDVAAAPFFAVGCYWLSKKVIKSQNAYIADN